MTKNTKPSCQKKENVEKREVKDTDTSELINDLPPEVRKTVEMGFSMQRFSGPVPNPILSKLNEGHIDKILDINEKEEDNFFRDNQINKRYNLVYFIIGTSIFIFLIVFLAKDNKDILLEILKFVIAILGGFGGGYGYKTYLDRKKNQ